MFESLCLECLPAASDRRNIIEANFSIRAVRPVGLADSEEYSESVGGLRDEGILHPPILARMKSV